MRGLIIAILVAAGVGLAGTAGVTAAPVTGAGILAAAGTADPVTQVQHRRWGSWGHSRWRSHYRWGSRRWRRWR